MRNVSVCMCVHQRAHRLQQMLTELDDQTVRPDEVLIWDNTPEGLDPTQYAKRFPITIIRKQDKNWGSQARFWLVPHARTETILFLDDDGIFEPDLVEHTLDYFERYTKEGPCLVGSHTRYIAGEKYISPHRHPRNSTLVDYIGTMGLMAPKRLFDDEPSLLEIPEACANVEDLYLGAIARMRYNYALHFIPKKWSIEYDKKDQFLRIGNQKQVAFEWLRKQGWKLLRETNPEIKA